MLALLPKLLKSDQPELQRAAVEVLKLIATVGTAELLAMYALQLS